MLTVPFRLMNDGAIMPSRANPTDAGLDLSASDDYFIGSEEKITIDTGLQVKIPPHYVGMLVARSSLQKKNLMLANNIGIIDADYRGNLKIVLYNFGTEDTFIRQGDRIAQLLIVPVSLLTPIQSYDEDGTWIDTRRGTGGFGSSGA